MGYLDERHTPDSIKRATRYLEGIWSRSREKWEKVDTYLDLSFTVWDQDSAFADRPFFRPGLGRIAFQKAVANQIAFRPDIRVPPAQETQAEEVNADKRERFLQSLVTEMFMQEMMSPGKQAGGNLIAFGYTTLEIPQLDYENQPRPPKKWLGEDAVSFKRREAIYERDVASFCPFRLSITNPARTLMDPYRKIPNMVVKKTTHRAFELHDLTVQRAEHWPGVDIYEITGDPYKEIDTLECWTRDWHALCTVEGSEMIIDEENRWGFMSFVQAFSGWGHEPTDSDQADPSTMAIGLLDFHMENLKIDAQALSGLHQILMRTSWPKGWTTKTREEAAEQAKDEIRTDSTRDDWGWEANPDLPSGIVRELDRLRADFEMGTFVRSLGGVNQPGVGTVGATAILNNAANRQFFDIGEQLNYIYSVGLGNILRLIEIMGKPVTVRHVTLKPNEINGNYAVNVMFEQLDPVIHLQEKQQAMAEYDRGLSSWETYQDVARRHDVTRERDRLLDDDLRKHPTVRDRQVKAYAKGRGLANMFDEEEERGRQAANGARGSGLVDVQGNPLTSPMGEPTANPAEPGSDREVALAARQLRQPLNNRVAKPPQITIGR